MYPTVLPLLPQKLKWIEKKEKDIHVRLDPLAERLKEREETAERIRKQIEQAVEQFGGVSVSASATAITWP